MKRKYRYLEILVKDEYKNRFVSFYVPFTREVNEYVDDLKGRGLSPRMFVRIRTKNDGASC